MNTAVSATAGRTAAIPVVRRTLTVDAAVQRAFSVFTEGFASWWPKVYTVSSAPDARVVIEPREGWTLVRTRQ
jgi:hypothetical protein